MTRPIPDSYWVIPGRLLAGEYPGATDHDEARAKLRRVRDAGVTLFLDLTEEDELIPYEALLDEDLRAIRMPIRDLSTPSREEMTRILDVIDSELEAGSVVYVHCYGGIGRTGTVVGCHLVRRGMSGADAIETIARWRRDTPDGARRSPETDDQRRMILGWSEAPSRQTARGSRLQVQTYVNRRAGALSQAVLERFPDLAAERPKICWTAPLEHEAFAEPRDGEFLRAVGYADLAAELGAFWPARGPVWDALAIAVFPTGRPGVVLAEGKSYPDELLGPGTQAGELSRARIAEAIASTQRWLRLPEAPEEWLADGYQTANRLAHLYWLREVAGVPAWFVHVLFTDDHTHQAVSRESWEAALAGFKRSMKLDGRDTPYAAEVFLPALDPRELTRPPMPA